MATNQYSGALMRARFSAKPPVPGVNADHTKPDPEPDPFSPVPVAETHPGDVWQPEDIAVHTEMQVRPVTHWTQLQAPVPSSVPPDESGIAATVRMLANHSVVDFRPDKYQPYKHATQGRSIEYTPGRGSFESGETIAEDMQYLVAGTNAYDFTNQPNEVYSGDAANVGRYRLGMRIEDNGLYDFWTHQGQEAELRAYTGLEPQFPVDKPRVENSAPYTPNSSGTTTWTLDSFQMPSLFSLPSETAVTDYITAEQGYNSEFDDGGRM